MSVAWVGAGIAAVGTISQMDAAKSASRAQSGSSDQANMMQMIQQMQLREDLKPWTSAGAAAQSRLNQYLGIGGVGSSGMTSLGLATGLTPDQVRQQLLSRFTKQVQPVGAAAAAANKWANDKNYQDLIRLGATPEQAAALREQDLSNDAARFGNPGGNIIGWNQNGSGNDSSRSPVYGIGSAAGGPVDQVDEEGLAAAIKQYYDEQSAQNAAAEANPLYGSLLRPYRNGEEFSYTGKDLLNDPGYKFGLDQGTQGIERGQASRGNFLSGGAMKELARYNEDYAGTKYNEGFNRALSTWNTNLGAYNQNRNSIYSFLTGQSQIGQNSALQVGSAGNQAATTMGNNLMSGANVTAAGDVAASNALVSGANSLVNAFRTNNSSNPSSAANWNSLISAGGSPYGGSSTSVNPGTGWVPSNNYFGAANGRLA